VFAWRGGLDFDHRRLVRMGGCAVLVVVLGTGYGAWVAVAGPGHITGSAQPANVIAGESIDPFGLVVPTLDQRFVFGHAALGDSFVAIRDPNGAIVLESPSENGSYVGVPLLLGLVVGGIVLRRKRMALFSALMGAIALVLSLGPHLHIDGHLTQIPLPFVALTHLPLLDSSEAARWVTYFWLFAALLLALLLDRVVRAVAPTRRASYWGGSAAGALLAVVLLLPLVPAWPYAAAAADVPAWFTQGARSLPAGSNAVIYPFATSADDSAMLWQAMADLQFRMPGGFAVIPGPTGANTFAGEASPLQAALAACQGGAASAPGLSAPAVRAQLQRWHTRTVAVVPTAAGARCATALFTQALGPPQRAGGVLLWPDPASAS
jgi:hypothetical protein